MNKDRSKARWHILWWLFTIFGTSIALPWLMYNFINIIIHKHKKASLSGKVVMITGASSGLGEALAHVFYNCGCRLILISRRKEELLRVKNILLNTHHTVPTYVPVILPLDISEINSSRIEIQNVLKIYGQIDILINNAGVSFRGKVINTSIDVDTKIMLINYFGQISITKAVLPWMIRQSSGCIVCISSIQGKIAVPYRSAYAASKHALQAWCDSARAELYSKNIKIIVISPGYIQTSLSLNAIKGNGQKYGVMDESTKNGYSPAYAANKVLNAILNGENEVILTTFVQKVTVMLRNIFPVVYFNIMEKYSKKHNNV